MNRIYMCACAWVILPTETLVSRKHALWKIRNWVQVRIKFWFGRLLSDLRQISLSLGLLALIFHGSVNLFLYKKMRRPIPTWQMLHLWITPWQLWCLPLQPWSPEALASRFSVCCSWCVIGFNNNFWWWRECW